MRGLLPIGTQNSATLRRRGKNRDGLINKVNLALLLLNLLLYVCFFVSPFFSIVIMRNIVMKYWFRGSRENIRFVSFISDKSNVISSSQSSASEESIKLVFNCKVTEYWILCWFRGELEGQNKIPTELPVVSEQWLPFRFPFLIGISWTFIAICKSPFYFHFATQTFRFPFESPSFESSLTTAA